MSRYHTYVPLTKVYSNQQVTRPMNCQVYDETLLRKLVQFRREVADLLHVPEYTIYQNNSLVQMAHKRPTDREALKGIWGVTNRTLKKYGFAFLSIINEHMKSIQEEDLPE